MLTGILKRLIIMVALVGFVRTDPARSGAVRAGASSTRGGGDSAAVNPRPARHRLPVEEGCRVPAPAPETPPPPASCS